MIRSGKRRRLVVVPFVAASMLATVLGGCALAPGMYMGKTADQSQIQQQPQTDATTGQNLRFVQLDTATVHADPPAPAITMPADLARSADPAAPYAYRIGAQDLLRIIVWDHPELNNPGLPGGNGGSAITPANVATATSNTDPLGRVVQPDGTIFYPYIGSVRVAGRTTDDVRREITTRLAPFFNRPQLDVSVTAFRSQKAISSGQLTRPGVVPITDVPLRVADMVNSSGGLTDHADLRNTTVSRRGRTIAVDLYAFLYQGDMTQNIMLQDGDVLNVPEQRYNKVFLLGEIARTGSYEMPRGRYSLAEALTDAAGASQLSANAKHIYVIRKEADGVTNVYHLDAEMPAALALADDFDLRPRDVVYVDPTQLTRFNRVLTQLLGFASGAGSLSSIPYNISR
jgi:polysaccharide export outer membrane protein